MLSLPVLLLAAGLSGGAQAARTGFTGQTVISTWFPGCVRVCAHNAPPRVLMVARTGTLRTKRLRATTGSMPTPSTFLRFTQDDDDPLTDSRSSIDFFVAELNSDASLATTTIYNAPDLQEAVSLAHGNGSTIGITVGGWSGSRYFSTVCADSTKRQTLATNIYNYLQQYDLDSIDIDWEFPNNYGAGNEYSSADVANFLTFLQLLRTTVGDNIRISLAVPSTGYSGSDGKVVADMSGFASVVDYIVRLPLLPLIPSQR